MTYEYVCEACGHSWEQEQPISAEPERDCPACHERRAKRLINSTGSFSLRGEGWFKTGGY